MGPPPGAAPRLQVALKPQRLRSKGPWNCWSPTESWGTGRCDGVQRHPQGLCAPLRRSPLGRNMASAGGWAGPHSGEPRSCSLWPTLPSTPPPSAPTLLSTLPPPRAPPCSLHCPPCPTLPSTLPPCAPNVSPSRPTLISDSPVVTCTLTTPCIFTRTDLFFITFTRSTAASSLLGLPTR